MDKVAKQEASIPVQARINICCLADVGNYWEVEGYHMKSMSQLVAWSVELLSSILKNNGKTPMNTSVIDAHNWLRERGLYQASMKNRAFTKIGTAIRFEGMRGEGIRPENDSDGSAKSYNILHNKDSVNPFMGQVVNKKANAAIEKYHELYDENGNLRVPAEARPMREKMTDAELEAKEKELEEVGKKEDVALDEFLANVK